MTFLDVRPPQIDQIQSGVALVLIRFAEMNELLIQVALILRGQGAVGTAMESHIDQHIQNLAEERIRGVRGHDLPHHPLTVNRLEHRETGEERPHHPHHLHLRQQRTR